jgi:hypothetical protein
VSEGPFALNRCQRAEQPPGVLEVRPVEAPGDQTSSPLPFQGIEVTQDPVGVAWRFWIPERAPAFFRNLLFLRLWTSSGPGLSKAKSCAHDWPAELHIPDEAVVLLINIKMTVSGARREPVVKLVAESIQKLPCKVRCKAETADVGLAGEEKAPAELSGRAQANDGVGPCIVVLGATSRPEARPQVKFGVDVPDPGGEDIDADPVPATAL